jgi:hypothetical protein
MERYLSGGDGGYDGNDGNDDWTLLGLTLTYSFPPPLFCHHHSSLEVCSQFIEKDHREGDNKGIEYLN